MPIHSFGIVDIETGTACFGLDLLTVQNALDFHDVFLPVFMPWVMIEGKGGGERGF